MRDHVPVPRGDPFVQPIHALGLTALPRRRVRQSATSTFHAAATLHAAASSLRSARLACRPPAYPPSDPSERTTRWQGTTTGNGLVAHAAPTARTAFGLPAAAATAA